MSNFANYLLKDSEKVDKKIFINNKIKYSQLNKIVNNVSKKILIDFKNKLFGLSLGLSEEFLIFYLAIIQSGNTVVLLETGLSNERYVEICKKFNVTRSEIGYIGDDVNDYKIMKMVGFSATPANGVKQIKNIANFITETRGGEGVFREVADTILFAKNIKTDLY